MENKIIISPSPHIHSGDSIKKNMYGVLIALLPALAMSVYQFGIGAVIVTAVSVLTCCIVEYPISKYMLGKEPTIMDGSAILTGVLLAFNLPSNLPVWIIIIGAVVAIALGKMSFGGLGNNIFNPALVGRVFLLISFPAQMTLWPTEGQMTSYLDAETGATPLGLMKAAMSGDTSALANIPTDLHMFIGEAGSLGEVSAIALLLGLVYMLYKKIITWHIPVSIFASVIVLAGILHLASPTSFPATPWFHLFSGGMMLGAIFMATDYVTSPMTKSGQILYGCLIGLLTVVIRTFGAYPEGMSFAILIMNGMTPLINTYMKPKHFGGKNK
ncbi:RnfABCDGE type electron transport complex subunit D [Porphyromonas gingivalis]|uniref:RnfABCDGE type electron transport complex subunit D n=1 Tax=Porphyromonas gingivalis TaxID=837 RepID=UPI000B4E1A8F|nr:RnfABCDGE type electron transport complex subunit D [Porphyromonas gingivalis]OWR79462.1 Na+-transporting NADH:ubiquinone oxidoreductase electron transport complex protein RnfD [Porphyromonas gingivalis SJD4]